MPRKDATHVLALEDEDPAVAAIAIDALVENGKDAIPLLIELLKRPRTSYIACAAIEQIGPEAKDTVPELIEVLKKTKHSQLQIQALLSLGKIGSDSKWGTARGRSYQALADARRCFG